MAAFIFDASGIVKRYDRSTHGLSRLTLISADQELNAAAIAEGIDVDDPTAHP